MRLAAKILTVFGVTIALLIALSMIRGTVQDRQQYRAEAVQEVARSTAGAQSLDGPVLFVPYSDRVVTMQADASGVQRRVEQVETGTWVFFPDSLELRGTMRSLPRMRGLYEVRVFELDTTLRAAFRVRFHVTTTRRLRARSVSRDSASGSTTCAVWSACHRSGCWERRARSSKDRATAKAACIRRSPLPPKVRCLCSTWSSSPRYRAPRRCRLRPWRSVT